jgi:Bifunctional DNA primase/polymerase, N-terminal
VTMLDRALGYARGGGLVLPLHTPTNDGCSCRRRGCAHVGKHPRTMNGLHDATADLDTVARWWGMWPEANIGIRPHPGQVVGDVDPRHAGDVQWRAMQDRHGTLPPTRTCRTGSGGWHAWFLCPGEVRGALASGVDVKSSTGFLVCPPSLHESGRRYEWIDDGPIAEAPEYLRRLLARPVPVIPTGTGTVTPAVVAGLVRTVAEAPPGTRNARLYWACSRAFEKGVDINPLVDAAIENGLSRREAERTAASAASAPARAGVTR